MQIRVWLEGKTSIGRPSHTHEIKLNSVSGVPGGARDVARVEPVPNRLDYAF